MREIIVEVDGVNVTVHVHRPEPRLCDRRIGLNENPCLFTKEEHHIDAKTRSSSCGLYLEPQPYDLVLSIEESRDLLTKLRLFSCIRDESEKQLLKSVWDIVMTDINNALAPYRKRDI